jgi:hypothetical protein
MSEYNLYITFGHLGTYALGQLRQFPFKVWAEGEQKAFYASEFPTDVFSNSFLSGASNGRLLVQVKGDISCRESILYYMRRLSNVFDLVCPVNRYGVVGFAVVCKDEYSEEYLAKASRVFQRLYSLFHEMVHPEIYNGKLVLRFQADSFYSYYVMSLFFWIFRKEEILQSLYDLITEKGFTLASKDLLDFLCENFAKRDSWGNTSNRGILQSMSIYSLVKSEFPIPIGLNGPVNAAKMLTGMAVEAYLRGFWMRKLPNEVPESTGDTNLNMFMKQMLDSMQKGE